MATSLALQRTTTPEPKEWAPSLRGSVIAGVATILLGFGGFLTWGYSVELDSAAVASGSVVVDTRRKTITHLEGGILQQMLVTEGQEVTLGQPLVQLENTRAGSELRQLQSKRVGLLARLARLNAEQEGAASIAFPAELGGADPYFQEIQRNETLLFQRRRETFERTIDVQRKQIDVFTADADAAAAQLKAIGDQRALMQTQIDGMQILVDKGYATRTQLVELQGKLSILTGDSGEYAGSQARAEQNRAGAELEISKTQTAWQSEVADAMQAAQIELNGLDDGIAAAADVFRRVEIVAPEAGIVANIQFTTPGGVVGAGQPIMDIIPENDARIIEARMDPRDIDAVQVGASVQVRLPSYNMRQTAPLPGTLSYVAADKTIDERSGASYYIVRATVSDATLAKTPSVELYPGMPADLLILNRPRLAIDYILSPFTDSFSRAFHEE